MVPAVVIASLLVASGVGTQPPPPIQRPHTPARETVESRTDTVTPRPPPIQRPHAATRDSVVSDPVVRVATPPETPATRATAVPSPTTSTPIPRSYPRRLGRIYSGLAATFGVMGLAVAGFRSALHQCGNESEIRECGDYGLALFLAPVQTALNLNAVGFAGAASGMFGRGADDSARKQVRLRIAGTTSLTFGVLLGVTAYALLAVHSNDVRGYRRLSSGRIAMAEVGTAAAIAGIVLLARTVAQRHLQRHRVDVGFAPARGGASVSLVGRF